MGCDLSDENFDDQKLKLWNFSVMYCLEDMPPLCSLQNRQDIVLSTIDARSFLLSLVHERSAVFVG